MGILALTGQVIVGVIFAHGAVVDILERKTLLSMLKQKKLRYEEILLYGAIVLKIVCGLGLIFDVAPHVSAFILAGFTLIANIIFHPFWSFGPGERKREYFIFITHLAIVGGLLAIAGG
ncbi:MAG TPA: DoxX family protein [Gammaproteobacteria bacterium]|jgi:putative oxidoreductase|nr:DoxX family protein [Gammaproteobacteria bacterium]